MAGARVLVVEDEAVVAMDLKRALEGFGYSVPGTAISGSEAIEIASETRPDVVLMDIQLDGQMDGIEVAHRLNELLDVPVVFLTAFSNESTLQRAKTAHPFGFLIKPYQERELRSAIEVALYTHGMEKKLRRRESWLDAILQGMADCVIATDAAGFVTFMNPPAAALTGRTLDQVRGLTMAKVLRLIDNDRQTIQLDATSIEGGVKGPTAAILVDAKGRETPVDFTLTRLQDDKRRPEGTVVVFRDLSLRLKAEQAEAVRRSEERLRALIEGGSDVIIVFDSEMKIRFASPSIEQFFGYTPDEAINTSILDYIIPEDRDAVIEALKPHQLDRHERVAQEHRARRRDGTVVVVETVSTNLLEHPLVKGIVVNARDVTDRKRAEQGLLRANRRLEILNTMWREIAAVRSPRDVVEAALKRLIELLPCEFASVSLADPQSRASTVFVAVGDHRLGPKIGERVPLDVGADCALAGDGGDNHCPDLGADGSGCPMARGRFGEAAASCVCASLRADGAWTGELHLVSRRPGSFENEDLEVAREVAGVIAVALHQARLRAELADQQRRLQALVDNLPEGVVCLDLDSRVTLANPPGRDLLRVIADAGVGDVVDQLAGRPVSEFFERQDDDPNPSVTVESRDHRTFEFAVVNLAEDRRAVVGHIIVIRELTREMETRKRLQLSERLASVGQLAAGIAHDFNNMLQAISGFAELIQTDDQLPSAVIEKARGISQQGKRGAGLIRQILDFSRTSVSERRPLRLELIIKETVRMLERIISEEVQLSTEIEPGEHVVLADPTQIQQVLINLAVNARDAMSGGGNLTLGLDRVHFGSEDPRPFPQMDPGEWVRLTVRDDGIGMPPEVASRVYEPFFTTKGTGKGTGLGLAQVYGIVKQNEGFIDLKTELGVGTEFVVYFPPATSDTREESYGDPSLAKVGASELVLLVEDEAPVRDVIHEMLETLGFEVVTAGSGSEAVQVFERFRSDIELVISDVVLPGIGGIEVSKKVTEINPDLPVVLMSGYPLGDEARSVLSAGTTDWISKPFSSDELARIISKVMASRQS